MRARGTVAKPQHSSFRRVAVFVPFRTSGPAKAQEPEPPDDARASSCSMSVRNSTMSRQ